jgi:hypothetical protein
MARTAPVNQPARELHSADLPITQPSAIDLSLDADPADRVSDIILSSNEMLNKDYLDELKFMEERVTVVLHRGSERHAPNIHDFYVNGKPLWIPVDQATSIPRKYLEVIARAQPFSVQTKVNKNEQDGDDAVVDNQAVRYQSAKYPFSVVKDENPRGHAWLAKVMREG